VRGPAWEETGDNGLLLSPRYGIRPGVGAILTDGGIPAVTAHCDPIKDLHPLRDLSQSMSLNALDNGGMDSFRCQNISGSLPAPVVSLLVRLRELKFLEPLLINIANRVAARSTAQCSACPFFKKYGGK
jgi:hypothetical protein